VAILLLIGLIGLGLQKIGCLPSEEALRSGVTITITKTEVVEPKNLFVVYYTVKNDAKWPASIQLEWSIRKTTGTNAATNSVTLGRVPARGSLDERIMFDLEELKRAGINDPTDSDVCKVEFRIASIKNANEQTP